MPGPRYERIPLEEEHLPRNTHNYFHPFSNTNTSPPTAPPSFHSLQLNNQSPTPSLPHRNDENATTIMPRSERRFSPEQNQDIEDDDSPISLWEASECTSTMTMNTKRGVEGDNGKMKEEIMLRLLNAVERLENRLDCRDAAMANQKSDLEALSSALSSSQTTTPDQRKKNRDEILTTIGVCLFVIIFLVWIAAIIIIPSVARYKYAGAVVAAAVNQDQGLEVEGFGVDLGLDFNIST